MASSVVARSHCVSESYSGPQHSTVLLLATCYALVSNALRIFKKFELQAGEVVRFNDFLKALPKA